MDSVFEIAVVTPADDPIDRIRTLFSKVGVLTSPDPEHRGLRSEVEEALDIEEVAQLRDKAAVAVDDHDLAGSLRLRDRLSERLHPVLIKQSLIASLIDFSVEQCRIDLRVPNENRIDDRVNFLSVL